MQPSVCNQVYECTDDLTLLEIFVLDYLSWLCPDHCNIYTFQVLVIFSLV